MLLSGDSGSRFRSYSHFREVSSSIEIQPLVRNPRMHYHEPLTEVTKLKLGLDN